MNEDKPWLDELRDKVFIIAKESGVKEKAAVDIADKTYEHIKYMYPGDQLYVPKRLSYNIRNKEIYQKFTGNNHNALAREYNLSTREIYNIIKKEQQKNTKENQHDLF